MDLITVAQALHWFDLAAFYAEARRVLRPGGLIAVWTYGVFRFENPALDGLLQSFYADTLGSYWPPERVHVESGYRDLPFPFAEIETPRFDLDARLTREALLGYLGTWSAVARYRAAQGDDPLRALNRRLDAVWGAPADHAVRWPLALRLGAAQVGA